MRRVETGRVEPAVRVRAGGDRAVEDGELSAHAPPAALDGRLVLQQPERVEVEALPERVGPVDKLARIVEREHLRGPDAGRPDHGRSHRFGARVRDAVLVQGSQSQDNVPGGVDEVRDAGRREGRPRFVDAVAREERRDQLGLRRRAEHLAGDGHRADQVHSQVMETALPGRAIIVPSFVAPRAARLKASGAQVCGSMQKASTGV